MTKKVEHVHFALIVQFNLRCHQLHAESTAVQDITTTETENSMFRFFLGIEDFLKYTYRVVFYWSALKMPKSQTFRKF